MSEQDNSNDNGRSEPKKLSWVEKSAIASGLSAVGVAIVKIIDIIIDHEQERGRHRRY